MKTIKILATVLIFGLIGCEKEGLELRSNECGCESIVDQRWYSFINNKSRVTTGDFRLNSDNTITIWIRGQKLNLNTYNYDDINDTYDNAGRWGFTGGEDCDVWIENKLHFQILHTEAGQTSDLNIVDVNCDEIQTSNGIPIVWTKEMPD